MYVMSPGMTLRHSLEQEWGALRRSSSFSKSQQRQMIIWDGAEQKSSRWHNSLKRYPKKIPPLRPAVIWDTDTLMKHLQLCGTNIQIKSQVALTKWGSWDLGDLWSLYVHPKRSTYTHSVSCVSCGEGSILRVSFNPNQWWKFKLAV